MGGSHTEVYQPTPPPQPSTADAVKAWAESMPTIYETQLQYAPLQAQQQVELAQQYAQPLGEAYLQAQKAMYPETSALQEQLAGQASVGMESPMPESLREQYLSDLRANLGTNVGSPIGADYTSRAMLNEQENWRRYYRDLALSVSGRQPLAQPTSPAYSNYMGNFTPTANMGYMSNTYGTFAQASRPIPLQQGPSPIPQMLGNFAGTIGSAMIMSSSRRYKRNIRLWARQ